MTWSQFSQMDMNVVSFSEGAKPGNLPGEKVLNFHQITAMIQIRQPNPMALIQEKSWVLFLITPTLWLGTDYSRLEQWLP